MAQYISKSAIAAEIERKIKEINLDIIEDWRNRIQREHDIEVMKNILSLIDTIEVKEVDLEQISKHYALNNSPWDDCWPEVQDAFKAGFELGLKAQKGGKV